MKKFLPNLGLTAVAIFITLVLLEIFLRIGGFSEAVCKPHFLPDSLLEIRFQPNYCGIDSLGFRNPRVPAKAQIVFIGDSQTYGWGVPKYQQIYPYQLARQAHVSIYTMAVGGYGPVQYWALLEQSLRFHPNTIIIAFYPGNDLVDAYSLVRKIPRWKKMFGRKNYNYVDYKKSYQNFKIVLDNFTPAHHLIAGSWKRSLKNYLSNHSVLLRFLLTRIRILLTRPIKTKIPFKFYQKANHKLGAPHFVPFQDENVKTVFTPLYRFSCMNLEEPAIQEGMRITQNIIALTHQWSQQHKIPVYWIFIPTKETAYQIYLQSRSFEHKEVLQKLWNMESRVREIIRKTCQENHVPFLDVTNALQKAASAGKQLYPFTPDGHPNEMGHQVIARALLKFLFPTPNETAFQ